MMMMMMMSMSSTARFLADVFLETLQNLLFFFLGSFSLSRSWFRHGLPLSLSSTLTIASRFRGNRIRDLWPFWTIFTWLQHASVDHDLPFQTNLSFSTHHFRISRLPIGWVHIFSLRNFHHENKHRRLIETNVPNNLVWSDEFFSDLKFQSPSYQM